MKEAALLLVRNAPDASLRLNLLREYLQALILRSLHESEAFIGLSLVGGTALRFLFGLAFRRAWTSRWKTALATTL